MDVRYLSLPEVLYLHAKSLRRYGGSAGIRDEGALDSAIARPRTSVGGSDAFPTVYLKSACYLDSFCRNHPFVDGNKRVAYLSADQFLNVNSIILSADESDAYEFVIAIVTDRLPIEQIANWIELHCSSLASCGRSLRRPTIVNRPSPRLAASSSGPSQDKLGAKSLPVLGVLIVDRKRSAEPS